jgi:hypothetical protein
MPYKDFTEELTRLQNANIGAGFIMQAQADAMKRQDQATINTMALFNQSKSNLEGDVLTTNEQLEEMQKSDAFKDGTESIDKMASNYEAMLNTSLLRQQKITDMYQKTVRDLAGIGSQESLQMAEVIGNQLPLQLEQEKSRMLAPMERLKFNEAMLGIKRSKLDIQKSGIEISELLKNIDVSEKVGEIMADEKTGWSKLTTMLGFDTGSGKFTFAEEKDKFFRQVYMRLEGSPVRNDVLKVLDTVIESRIRNFKREVPQYGRGGSGLERLQEDELTMLGRYEWLQRTSRRIHDLENDPTGSNARLRNDYRILALEKLDKLKIDPLSKEGIEYMKFGSQKEIVDMFDNSEAANYNIIEDGVSRPAKDALLEFYNNKYNSSSREYYPLVYNQFKRETHGGKNVVINPMPVLSESQKKDLNKPGELKDTEVRNFNGKAYGRYKPKIKSLLTGTEMEIDFSSLISFESGDWYDPYNDATLKYFTSTPEEREKADERRKAKLGQLYNIDRIKNPPVVKQNEFNFPRTWGTKWGTE